MAPTPLRAQLTRGLGVVLLCAPIAVALFGRFASAAQVSALLDGGIGCPFRAATTVPCPLCNITHATVALGQGRIADAFAHHPLFVLALALWMWASWQLVRRPRDAAGAPRLLVVVVILAVIWAGNLIGHYA